MATRETTIDARTRAVRTVVQGLISQVTPGAVVDWVALGTAVATAAGTAITAYVHRLLSGVDLDPVPGDGS